jgi:hypothetical protein
MYEAFLPCMSGVQKNFLFYLNTSLGPRNVPYGLVHEDMFWPLYRTVGPKALRLLGIRDRRTHSSEDGRTKELNIYIRSVDQGGQRTRLKDLRTSRQHDWRTRGQIAIHTTRGHEDTREHPKFEGLRDRRTDDQRT